MTPKTNSYIILVEDNSDDIELTRLAFNQNRFANRIEVFKDGEEAYDFLLSENSKLAEYGDPVFILLDLKLPKIDGLELLKQLKENPKTRHIPVIILTSSKQEDDIMRGYELGANSYVRKPVDYNNFVKTVNTLGIYWLAVNEPPTT